MTRAGCGDDDASDVVDELSLLVLPHKVTSSITAAVCERISKLLCARGIVVELLFDLLLGGDGTEFLFLLLGSESSLVPIPMHYFIVRN